MRIVSLLPSATDIVVALGLGRHLVAVSHSCDAPEVAGLPRITRSILDDDMTPQQIDEAVARAAHHNSPLYRVDAHLLDTLQPDLVLTQGVCEVCAVSPNSPVDRWPEALPPHTRLLSLDATTLDGVFEDILAVGAVTETSTEAETVVKTLRDRRDALRDTCPETRPSLLVLEWTEPPFYGGHWVPEMTTLAGATTPLGGPGQPSGRATWAEIIGTDPDILVVAACGDGLGANITHAKALFHHPEASRLTAVQQQRVWACDANRFFSRPSVGLVRGAEVLRAILAGDEIEPSEARRMSLLPARQVAYRAASS